MYIGMLPAVHHRSLCCKQTLRLEDITMTQRQVCAGGSDDKGCWSGCCAVDQHGVPTIMYTGVRCAPCRPPPDTLP